MERGENIHEFGSWATTMILLTVVLSLLVFVYLTFDENSIGIIDFLLSRHGSVTVPNSELGPAAYRWLYSHGSLTMRSNYEQISLVDLNFYIHQPGQEFHFELLEESEENYVALRKSVTRLLNRRGDTALRDLIRDKMNSMVLEWTRDNATIELIHIRDRVHRAVMKISHMLLFNEAISTEGLLAAEKSCFNFYGMLKTTSVLDMNKRLPLYRYLVTKVTNHFDDDLNEVFEGHFSIDEIAKCLHAVFFHSFVTQLSEALTHVILEVSQNQDVDRSLRVGGLTEDRGYIMNVIRETLRLNPVFGITVRSADSDIVVPSSFTTTGSSVVIKSGTVVIFNDKLFHRSGYDRPTKFLPDRWNKIHTRNSNFLPFGARGNHVCPAEKLAYIFLQESVPIILKSFKFRTNIRHLCRIPCGGMALTYRATSPRWVELTASTLLIPMKLLVLLEQVYVSLAGLVVIPIFIRRVFTDKMAIKRWNNLYSKVKKFDSDIDIVDKNIDLSKPLISNIDHSDTMIPKMYYCPIDIDDR